MRKNHLQEEASYKAISLIIVFLLLEFYFSHQSK